MAPTSPATMEDVPPQEEKKCKDSPVDLDTAIHLTGFGRFHYGLVLASGACFMSAGFQNGLNAYILPSAQCDLGLSSNEKGLLNAAFITGSVCSTFVWGSLADTIGRKRVLVSSLIIDSIITFLTSFVQAYHLFVICRFFSGFIVGAPACLIFAYLSEFHTAARSSASMCFVGFFWTLSWMLLPALAWVVIPLPWAYHSAGFVFNSWRFFMALLSLPSLASGLSLQLLYPESPQFLHSSGRSRAALAVLQHMFVVNTGKPACHYQVRELQCPPRPAAHASTASVSAKHSKLQLVEDLLRGLFSQAKKLLVPPLLRHTAICSALLFTNMFGYFGLGLWLPELFNRLETYYTAHPNDSISVCEVPSILPNNASLEQFTGQDCSGIRVDSDMFMNTIIIGAACILGNILSSALAGYFGLKAISIATMIVAGCSGISIYFLQTSLQNLLVSCVFLACISTANFVLTGIVVEIFPTKIRGMATCLAILSGRVGAIVSNLIFGLLLDLSCEVPIFLVGSVVIGGGFLGFLISKKQDTGMT